jgi:hypothetical protein
MTEGPLTPDQEAEIAALTAEFERHLERVGIDATSGLAGMASPVEHPIADDEFDMTFSVNASEIVETLRALPDGAGMAAFRTAFEERHRRGDG